MTPINESVLPDPRGSDHERALFLSLLWDGAVEAHVQRRTEDEIARSKSALMAEMDDEKIRAIKFAVADLDSRKRQIESEGRFEGIVIGFFAAMLLVFLIGLAVHHR